MPLLAANSIAHLLVDAVCAAALFSCGGDLGFLAALYNTLAFSTQCLAGLVMDRFHQKLGVCGAAACLAVALGALLPLGDIGTVIIVGLGNSLFHVCAGTEVLISSRGRAAGLGVFVAPGAVGLALGALYPYLGAYFAAALIICAVPIWRHRAETAEQPGKTRGSGIAVLLLLAAVAVRAAGGSAADFTWKTGSAETLLLAVFVFAGKTAGGLICDRLGASKAALLSLPLAAVLTAFFAGSMFPALGGQLLLNLTMPVTLWLLYRALPGEPALAFGLAASALWPGALLGGVLRPAGGGAKYAILAAFAFGLAAIIVSDRDVKEKDYEKAA